MIKNITHDTHTNIVWSYTQIIAKLREKNGAEKYIFCPVFFRSCNFFSINLFFSMIPRTPYTMLNKQTGVSSVDSDPHANRRTTLYRGSGGSSYFFFSKKNNFVLSPTVHLDFEANGWSTFIQNCINYLFSAWQHIEYTCSSVKSNKTGHAHGTCSDIHRQTTKKRDAGCLTFVRH